MAQDDLYAAGTAARREVMGEEHVRRAQARTTGFDEGFQRFITQYAWGTLWASPALDRRTRSLITIGILASLGREELTLHLRAIRRTGVTEDELREVLMHVAVYAGVPAANAAFAKAKAVLEEEAPTQEEKP